ncbi:biliverdin-producing heme oxygenase [Lentzea sp. NPDC060358]|uniref:biliverdin-producing heme oxygenase n=1 Tax=Lentzea sp. NPDC060358 TaxID=3347103 RepID=UPI0036524100
MSLLARLRTDTRAAHLALDGAVGFRPGSITASRYEEVLAAFLGVHEPLEEALEASIAAHGLPWELSPGAGRLAADLRGLGWSAARIAELPRAAPPVVATVPALVGSLYVVEGAKLGGQLITRWVADALGAAPVSFFAADGDARARFRRFGALAETVLTPGDASAASEAAVLHFRLVDDWLAGRVRPAGPRLTVPAARTP